MSRPSVDDMLAGRTSRYALVIAVAKRAREISSEAEAKEEIRDFENHKYVIDEPDRND